MTAAFEQALADAIRWCSAKNNVDQPERALRSDALAPPVPDSWLLAVESVCERRAALLARRETDGSIAEGRLLVFDPDQSLSDGAAAVESSGFFDDDNTPPWDTWVAYIADPPQRPGAWTAFDAYLVCWIPAVFVELVERAIAVIPEECVQWADDVDRPFLRRGRR